MATQGAFAEIVSPQRSYQKKTAKNLAD